MYIFVLFLYLPQVVSLPPLLGICWELFQRSQLLEEVQLEPA